MSPKTPAQNEQIRVESKQKIMDAAFRLIAKNGYEATSIASIATKAGVSKGLLYNYFESKEALIEALVLAAMEEGDELLENMISDDPVQTLRNMFVWFFKEIRERHDHWRLLTELTFKIDKFDFVHDMVTAKMNEYVGVLEHMLEQMDYKDALGEARIISALLDGVSIQAMMVREDYPLEEMEKYLIKKYCDEV